MKFALEWSIKIFWAMIGLICVYLIIHIFGCMLSGQFPPASQTGSFWLSSLIVFLYAVPAVAILAFCTLLIYYAYLAWFRFSERIVGPTVAVPTIVMFGTGVQGQMHFLQPLIEQNARSSGGAIVPLVGLITILFFVGGLSPFYRLTVASISKLLFPSTGISYSAARRF